MKRQGSETDLKIHFGFLQTLSALSFKDYFYVILVSRDSKELHPSELPAQHLR